MSKFIDQVKAELLTGRKSIYLPLEVSQTFDPSINDDRLSEYKVSVGWIVKCYCKQNEIPVMQESVIRELREAVYGDLYQRIIRLERAIYDRNDKLAQMEMRDIVKEIYG